MTFTRILATVLLVASHAAPTTAATAMAATAASRPDPQPVATTAAVPTVEGEVRKIDKDQGKVTLKHGPIGNLEMPGMTMVFRVADPAMLDTLKEGDKVRFSADRVDGAITVTAIEVAK